MNAAEATSRSDAATRLAYAFLGLVAFSLLGSAASRATALDPGPVAPLASAATIVSGVAALALAAARATAAGPRRAALGLVAVLLLGLVAEVVGLYTGAVFGRYVYTGAWWPSVGLPEGQAFPLLLPLAWFLIVAGSFMALPARWPWAARVLGAAALATLVDLVMEPVMTERLGYWRWDPPGPLPGGAPAHNAIGWLVVSALAAAILYAARFGSAREARWVLAGFVALVAGLSVVG
jgi:uncharacterized membrane protein